MKRILLLLLILPFMSRAQVFNPVPDMIFKGGLSAGRSTATDNSAYMSIGPARGATKGLMAPMVSDTNLVVQPRREGLLIFSLQKKGFLYWDSTSVRWRDFGGITLDTVLISTRAWRQKGVDSVASLPRVTAVFSGLGMKFDTIKTVGSVGVDTVIMATRPRVQKAVDSLSFVKQDKLTLTTLGTTGPATLAGSVLNIPNYSPGSGFLRNLGPIGTVPNINGMSKSGDTLRLQPASTAFGGIVTTSNQTFAGEKTFDERLRVGASGGAMIQKTDQFTVGIGNSALNNSLGTVSNNTAIGYNAGRGVTNGINSVFLGSGAGDLRSNGQPNTNPMNSIFIGLDARPSGDNESNQIVIGQGGRGNGNNTTTIGNTLTSKTHLMGRLNVNVIDSGAPQTNILFSNSTNDVVRSARVPISAIDTGIIGTKAWRQKGVDSLSSVKQDNLSLTTTGNSGPSTLVGSTLNVPNYTLSGLGGVPSNRFITINGVSYDLSADRVWTITAGGGGTVTSVAAGVGMNFPTITTTGTVNADTGVLATRLRVQKVADSLSSLISGGGLGTVTSVSSGYGTNFSTITNSGSVVVDSVVIASRARVQKMIDSISALKQNVLTLTTTGSSGASTLINSTLNVPNYTLSGLGGVPTSRTLTINGTALDLSADRSWTISGGGTGTVTSVAAGTGMNFSTITTTGTVNADTLLLSTRAWRQKGIDSVVNLIASSGGGTVLSVSAGTGMNFSTITTTGSVSADTNTLATRARVQKPVDSLGAIKQNNISLTTTGSSGASTFDGTTLNVPNYTLSGLGGVPTSRTLTINGTALDLSTDRSWTISTNSGTVTSVSAGVGMNFGTITSSGPVNADTGILSTRAWRQKGIDSLSSTKQNNISLTTNNNSGASTFNGTTLNVPNYTLSGLGGVPSSRNITINGTTFDLSSDRSWTISSGTGTVTSVATGFGLTGGTITTTGTLQADTGSMATRSRVQKGIDSVAALPRLTGNGVSGYMARWTGASTMDTSQIFQSGGRLGIGTTSPVSRLSIVGDNAGVVNIGAVGLGGNTAGLTFMPTISAGNYAIVGSPSGDLVLNSATGQPIEFRRNNSNQMTLNSDGTLLIGTTSADNNVRLRVNGRARVETIDSSSSPSNMLWVDATGVIRKTAVPSSAGLSLTTNNTSGAATLSSNTLNVPIYVGGSGTQHYLPKFNSNGRDISNSRIYDNNSGFGNQGIGVNRAAGDNAYGGMEIAMSMVRFGGRTGGEGYLIVSNHDRFDSPTDQSDMQIDNNTGWEGYCNHVGGGGASESTDGVNLFQGSHNTSFGARSMKLMTRGYRNVAMGFDALYSNTTGYRNTVLGTEAFKDNTTGLENVVIGWDAGNTHTASSNSIFIGKSTRANANSQSHQIVIGDGSTGYGSNTTRIGNIYTTMTYLDGALDIDVIDSTSTAINMLYADANGVIKKTAVPSGGGGGGVTSVSAGTGMSFSTITTTGSVSADTGILATRARVKKQIDSVAALTSGATMSSSNATIASGWNFTRDSDAGVDLSKVTRTTNGTDTTIVLNLVVHKTTSTFSTGTWVEVATLPSGYRPSSILYGSIPNFVSGTGYENQSGTNFSADASYSGVTSFRIKKDGKVEVRIDVVDSSADLSGANYVIINIPYSFTTITVLN